jgi:hypothetical protein
MSMEQFYENLSRWVDLTAYNIWSYLLFLLFAVGAWLTIKTRFTTSDGSGTASS